MDNIKRLRQYLTKASFSSEVDRLAALECLIDVEQELDEYRKCNYCGGSGWIVRDPDIGIEQECFVCGRTGKFIDK